MSGQVGGGGKRLVAQQSTVWTRRQNAVCVRRAIKAYGEKKAQFIILDELNMTVPKGCIYGLLGASGCGKTTLLSCIVGRRRMDSGEIWVLGGKPGSKGSGVPGPRIGYMPQEMALYGEFTIRETMKYFGWVSGMTTDEIDERIKFLVDLLMLPNEHKVVKSLSGGQQRRVSLAAALLHKPELLILDEPTVGVDPILRQKIWDYLVEVCSDKSTTVIITTHYIDETRQADTIGLMRGGKLLAEESPNSLLEKYKTDSLEGVFLRLSILQNRGKRRRSSITAEVLAAAAEAIPELRNIQEGDGIDTEISGEFGDNMSVVNPRGVRSNSIAPLSPGLLPPADPLPPDEESNDFDYYSCLFTPHHMKALLWKNVLWMVRNFGSLFFMFTLPIGQIILFCLTVGRDPIGLKFGIVNNEVPFNKGCSVNTNCSFEQLSCRLLDELSMKKHDLVYYGNVVDAAEAVNRGKAWGFLEIPSNFSYNLNERIEYGRSASEETLIGSELQVTLDMSNYQIGFLLRKDMLLVLQSFARGIAKECGDNPAAISYPIRFNQPVYGPFEPNFTDFAAPGIILTITFFLAVGLAVGTMIIERNEGIMERGLVSGITPFEILASHVITQFANMFIQSIAVVVVALYVFDVTNVGNVLMAAMLAVLSGITGMVFGFLISCVADNERNATYIALGSFLPFVMLCGIIWPTEGMHKILRVISFFLPLTLSTEAMRSIFARGWTFDNPVVYGGFISLILWACIFMSATILVLKFKKG